MERVRARDSKLGLVQRACCRQRAHTHIHRHSYTHTNTRANQMDQDCLEELAVARRAVGMLLYLLAREMTEAEAPYLLPMDVCMYVCM